MDGTSIVVAVIAAIPGILTAISAILYARRKSQEQDATNGIVSRDTLDLRGQIRELRRRLHTIERELKSMSTILEKLAAAMVKQGELEVENQALKNELAELRDQL